MKKEIIIVGGGIAGLMAAAKISKKNPVTIIEAQDNLGGRIKTFSNEELIIEGGAEFIHGKLPLTLKLLKKADLSYLPVEGKMYRSENGHWKEQDDMIEGWDKLLKKMSKVKKDSTMLQFLDANFSKPSYAKLRNRAIAFTEGYDIADVDKVSVRSLYKEWSSEDKETFRITKGYGALVAYLQQKCERQGCKIITGKTISKIDWTKGEVTAHTLGGETYHANKVIITLPVGLLQKTDSEASIKFTPNIDKHSKAAEDIGYGSVVKVILHFVKSFWKADAGFILSEEIFPTWWTQLPDASSLLTGWAGGAKAMALSGDSSKVILEKALASLSAIFNISIDALQQNLKNHFVYNWHRQPYAEGAYSYATPSSKAAINLLRKPVEETIYFAGEAVYKGNHPGTVEAALISGKEVAKAVR